MTETVRARLSQVPQGRRRAVREVLGSGTLFASASLLLDQSFAFMETETIPDYCVFPLGTLPPGRFLALGLPFAGQRLL